MTLVSNHCGHSSWERSLLWVCFVVLIFFHLIFLLMLCLEGPAAAAQNPSTTSSNSEVSGCESWFTGVFIYIGLWTYVCQEVFRVGNESTGNGDVIPRNPARPQDECGGRADYS